MTQTLAQAIATACNAAKRCDGSPTMGEWADTWHKRLDWIERNMLPSGSGFDSGTTIDRNASATGARIVLNTSYHHMSEHGYYDGWTEHRVTIKPCLITGLSVTVSGRNRNDIKDCIAETLHHVLTQPHTWPTA